MIGLTAVLVAALLVAKASAAPPPGDLEPVLQRCCQSGERWAANHSACAGPPLESVAEADRRACHASLYICCVRTHRRAECERGKGAARAGSPCDASRQGTFQDCCQGCSLGIQVSQTRSPCVLSGFNFGTIWDEAFLNCCENSDSIQGTSAQAGRSRCETEKPCSQICEDIGTEIRCSCEPGYKLTADQRTCEDVDECLLNTHSCNRQTEVCSNSIGGFECLPQRNQWPIGCGPGYVQNPLTNTCDDVNECNMQVCPADKKCVNTVGSYMCIVQKPLCPNGFRYNERTLQCIDIDECIEGLANCDLNRDICENSRGSFQCIPRPSRNRDCPAGFKWNDNKDNCNDVDECSERSHSCNPETQYCVNSVGSYRCATKVTCPHGYRWSKFGNKCDEINECLEGTDDCDRRSQYCVNTIGSFQCQSITPQQVQRCGTGYVFNASMDICVDRNECIDLHTCLAGQICENTQGSYRCLCPQGYTMNSVTRQCNDINECQLQLHACAESQRCDNTVGSYTCIRLISCGTGYTLNAATGECEDDDECVLNTHNCGPGFECYNTGGSFRCRRVQCPPGQKLLSDGTCKVVVCGRGMETDDQGNCVDINECARSDVCRTNQRCLNTIGSYSCQNLLQCEPGFELNEFGNQCLDIDECARRIDECGPQQTCRNRPGHYTCECPRGYTLNAQRECEDIDECSRFRGQVCSSISECINTQGSYVCNCNEGFKKADDDKNCVDIDECAETPNICQQKCNNVWGSYQCSCKQGYTLGPDNRSCQDIDECKMMEGRGNLCIGFCNNVPGSYTCSCPNGYRLLSDKRTCHDIDECQEENVCNGPEEVCLNTRGGYKCNSIVCPPNYIRDKDHRNRCKRATRACHRDDPQCLKEPLAFSYNYITFVSNMRIPASGQLDLFTMRGPRFQSTTVQFTLELKEALAGGSLAPATREHFYLRRTSHNEALVSLIKPIQGPQDIELNLVMKIYHNGLFGGMAIAKLFLFVTPHEF